MSSAGTLSEIRFLINGEPKTVYIHPMTRLLDVLREQLGLTGAKEGCGEGECGSCSVLLNGELVNSCLVPILQCEGASITTIEGLSTPSGKAIQHAWVNLDVPQCGYCQSGQIMSAVALLKSTRKPTDANIEESMGGNLCRCATYVRIREAIKRAAEQLT